MVAKIVGAILMLPGLVMADGGTPYFTLPSNFQDNAIATLTTVAGVLVGIIAIYVGWRYFRAIFSKRG